MTEAAKVGNMETKHPATSTEIQQYDSLELPMHNIELTAEQIRKFIAPGATAEELFWFIGQCRTFNLNPLKKEIFFVKYKGKPGQAIVAVPVYLKRANRTGLLQGWNCVIAQDEFGEKAVLTIHRKDWSEPFVWETYRHEFDKKQAVWNIMPLHMTKMRCIGQGFRLCWPEELGAMPYLREELYGTSGLEHSVTAPAIEAALPEQSEPEPPPPAEEGVPKLCPECNAALVKHADGHTYCPRPGCFNYYDPRTAHEDAPKCSDCGMELKPGDDDPNLCCPNPRCLLYDDPIPPWIGALAKRLGTSYVIALDFATDRWPTREDIVRSARDALINGNALAGVVSEFVVWKADKDKESAPTEPQNGISFESVVEALAAIYQVSVADLGNFSETIRPQARAFLQLKAALEENGKARTDLYALLQTWLRESEAADEQAEGNVFADDPVDTDLPGMRTESPPPE